MDESQGTIDRKEDVSSIQRWLKELHLADKAEESWRKDAAKTLRIYHNDTQVDADAKQQKETYNILWANTSTQAPAIYNSTPRPDVRRRFKNKDVLGREVAKLLEQAAAFCLDSDSFETAMDAALLDYLLPGRCVTRVKYKPQLQNKQITAQDIEYEQVQYDDFRRGPGKTYKEVPWVAFRHLMSKDEVESTFPDFKGENLSYDISPETADDSKDKKIDKTDDSIFRKAEIWEIWDREEKKVIFLSKSYKDKTIKEVDDPMGLQRFWPIPDPVQIIPSSTTLVPQTEYGMYEVLARDLETVCNRQRRLTSALRARGIYDSTMDEVRKIFDANDNEMIPAENVSRLLESGGFDKAIWMFPNEKLVEVMAFLEQRKSALLQSIYEISGISDIMRGASNPNETLGAQNIKANWGSQRLDDKKEAFSKYARDIIRITIELIAEKFTPESLTKMTGNQYLTNQQKQQMQLQMQMQQQQAQQSGQQPPQPPPEQMIMLAKPSWEDIQAVMKDDILRNYRIDIESDSTVLPDQTKDMESLSTLMTGIAEFIKGIGPAVEAGAISQEGGKKLLQSMTKRFRLGREVEEAMDEEFMRQGPDPKQQEQQAKQQEAQAKQQEAQAKIQLEQQKLQSDQQKFQAEMQMEREKFQAEMQKSLADNQHDFELQKQKSEIEAAETLRKLEEDRFQFMREQDLKVSAFEAEREEKARELDIKERELAIKEAELGLKQEENVIKAVDFVYNREEGLRATNQN